MFFNAIKRWWKSNTLESRIVLCVLMCPVLLAVGAVFWGSIVDSHNVYREAHVSPAEQLRTALTWCPLANGEVTCAEPEMNAALGHLDKIMPNAPEHAEAEKLRTAIQALRKKNDDAHAAMLVQQKAEHDRLVNQSIDESRAQLWKNLNGAAHDPYICSTSTDGSAIISFDFGHYWWGDDGRCAVQQAQAKETAERKAEEERRLAQQKRDGDAELSSWWSTTLRVDTDMDSFWLNNEERTCQTYPDANGRVAVVSCVNGSKHDHNIPVKFWGGVDRNTVSDWKCRREGDEFVCRAIN